MPRFSVEVQEVHTQVITVEADNEQAARVQAELVLSTGVNQDGSDLPDATSYSRTVDLDEWRVWKE